MRKFTEELTNYIFENLTEQGTFAKKYSEIAVDLEITQQQARNAMLSIIKDGVLEVVVPSHKGISSNPIYKIKNHIITKSRETNPLEIDAETKLIVFEGVEIELIMTQLGYALSKESLAVCTLEQTNTIDKIISSNPELFRDHILLVDGEDYLDRSAVITYMLKVNLDRVHPIKRNMVALFQSQIVSIMCESSLKAKLVITEDHRIKIKHNLNCILELDSEQVEEMLIDLESQISNTIEPYKTQITKTSRQVDELRRNTQRLENRIENEKHAKDIAITEVRELKSKLFERS